MPPFFLDNMDMEEIPNTYVAAVVVDNAVALVRHFFADSGNANDIFNEFLKEKFTQK